MFDEILGGESKDRCQSVKTMCVRLLEITESDVVLAMVHLIGKTKIPTARRREQPTDKTNRTDHHGVQPYNSLPTELGCQVEVWRIDREISQSVVPVDHDEL